MAVQQYKGPKNGNAVTGAREFAAACYSRALQLLASPGSLFHVGTFETIPGFVVFATVTANEKSGKTVVTVSVLGVAEKMVLWCVRTLQILSRHADLRIQGGL